MFSEDEFIKYKLDLVKEEYRHLQANIRRLDDIGFKIRGWLITLWVALVTFTIKEKYNKVFLVAASGCIIIFWLIDICYKAFNEQFISRCKEIEDFLDIVDLTDSKSIENIKKFFTPYISGSIKSLDIKIIKFVITKRLHVHMIYIGLTILSIILYILNLQS